MEAVLEEQSEVVSLQQDAVGPMDRRLPWARWELVTVVLIVLLALGLRMWDLGSQALHHDESLHALYGWYIFDGRGYRHDPMMHGPFQFFGYASVFRLLWDSDTTVRLLPALFGTALVALPLLLRNHLGRTGTLLTALLLALSPTMLYFSRFARNDIYMAVWALLLVAFMWGYLDTRKTRYLVLSSVVLAFSFANKETVYILVAVLGSYLVIASATDVVPWVMGRKRLRSFSPQGELLILMATLALPLSAAAIALFQSPLGMTLANPDWTAGPIGMPKGTGLYVAFFAVVAAIVASVVVGLRWRPWVWLVCFGAFATVWTLLYSSFFANFPGGLFSGLWQSLGYWVVQQEVARGGQPWYYYIILGLNYEFLPFLVGTAAAVYYLARGDRFSLFLAYWTISSFLLYSYAGEKMPWLLVNVALPFILLAGKALGRLLERQPWQRSGGGAAGAAYVPEFIGRSGVTLRLISAIRGIHWPAVAFTSMLVLLVAVVGRWLVLALAEESGLGLRQVVLMAFVIPALVAACVYLLRQVGQSGKEKRLALVVVSVAGIMLTLSVQAAFRVTYANPDVPVELLVYTQTAPDIPQIMAEIERLGNETGKGRDLKITVDSTYGFSWPWAWYLRNYKFVGYPCFSNEPSCRDMEEAPEADVVLLAARNQASAERFMSDYGTPVAYKHRWWFPESYRGITLKTVWEGLRNRESWCRVVDYFLYRDFGLPLGSVESYAYFPKEFTPTPVGRDVGGNKSGC